MKGAAPSHLGHRPMSRSVPVRSVWVSGCGPSPSPINGPARRLADAIGGITMAHAGTMVGGSAQTKQSGSSWPALALAVAVAVAAIAGVWLASSAGLLG